MNLSKRKRNAIRESEMAGAAFAIAMLMLTTGVQVAYAWSQNITPSTKYIQVTNTHGKWSGSSGQDTSNGLLCPCEPSVSSHCSIATEGTGTVKEYKRVDFKPGVTSSTYSLSYYFYLKGVQYVGSGGSAYVEADVYVYDNSGTLITSTTAYSYTTTSGSTSFDGSQYASGTLSLGTLYANNNYSARFVFYISSSVAGTNDFYNPYWAKMTMIITTLTIPSP